DLYRSIPLNQQMRYCRGRQQADSVTCYASDHASPAIRLALAWVHLRVPSSKSWLGWCLIGKTP
ncbi:hypothetical protein, partial [Thiolapillus sp.]|uniref:hypothetical protein n=1 Tax=Thiolapillus sp. TaxID=2017437 RepID=UPI003AF98270